MNNFTDLVLSYPIIGLINSIILFFGFYYLGKKINQLFSFDKFLINISDLKYQNILVGVNFISSFLFLAVILSEKSKYLLYITSILIYLSGLIQIYKTKINRTLVVPKNLFLILIYIFLLGYFFLSLAPVTHGDALAYHIDVAKNILVTGSLPNTIYNFHHLLTGAGEVLMSVGFFFGSEQLNGLIQFSGLISLYGIYKRKLNFNNSFLLLLALSSPIIIFLISSSKPQLFSVCTNILIFSLIFLDEKIFSKNFKNIYSFLFFVCLLLINSINTKFSFILSSSILFFILLWNCYQKKYLKEFLIVISVSIIIFYLPFIFWKFINFGGNFVEYFFNPFTTSIPASDVFKQYLTNFKRSFSPIYLILPKDPGVLTDNLGLGFLVILSLTFILKKSFKFVLIIIFYFLIGYSFGQPSSRFFLEPYLWITLFVFWHSHEIKNLKYFKILCIQSILSLGIIWFGVFTLSIGSLSFDLRDKVLTRSADGYSLYKWANQKINSDGAVISIHRAISFGKNKTISTDYVNFINENEEAKKLYIDQISKYEPNYLVTWGRKNNVLIFEKCISELIYFEKKVAFHGTRNPFNRGSEYDGYIYKLKEDKLEDCID